MSGDGAGPSNGVRSTSTPIETEDVVVAARRAPGEDVEPLLRCLGGAAIGVAGALAVDALVPNGWTWPRLGASLVNGSELAGTAAILALAAACALLFVYGQVRRFVPARPVVTGIAWAAVLWTAGVPLLLSRATWLSADPSDVRSTLAASIVLFLETTAGVLVYGAVVGALNPPRLPPPDASG